MAARLLIAGIYAALILGAVTMVYPFLLMASGSMKSAMDSKTLDVVPAFLHDNGLLYRKHVEALFNESIDALRQAYDSEEVAFELVEPPRGEVNERWVSEWRLFLLEAPPPSYAASCGHIAAPVSKTLPQGLRGFRGFVSERHGGDIGDVNRALETEFVNWNAFHVVPANHLQRVRMPSRSPFGVALEAFKAVQPPGAIYYLLPEAFFRRQYLPAVYSRSIADYNAAHGTAYSSYSEVPLPRRAPEAGLAREDWEQFVRHNLNLLWVRVDRSAREEYQRFLRAKYGDIRILNERYGANHRSFSKVELIEEVPFEGLALSDWAAWISGWRDSVTDVEYRAPLESLSLASVEWLFRDYLEKMHGTIEQMNAALGTSFASFDNVVPPQRELHYASFLADRGAIRREFATRNFRAVADYILIHGRGVWNTAVYCSLSVLFALLVNPLAAYALSRYRQRSNYRVLLFLMLTMAFPPMVTQIPVFLMLRKLGLLNTFAALILPGLANGYSIFLLKGFFDSLPRELYESAEIDGAGEWTMFWNITMSLSTPILSVVALQAFTVAYANFMYALLICQDERMWTLMVWLYQLQERSGPGVVYASLILAALPTFLVFILCQKVILRGIVVPVER